MKNISLFLAPFLLFPALANAQDVWQLMSARDYHAMKPGPEKTQQVRQLESNGWYQPGSRFLDLKGKPTESPKTDLAPFVDDLGETVFLVTDVAPEFPGGTASLNDYLQNSIADLLSKPGEVTQNTLFVKFSVTKEGKIEATEPAQPFPTWVPTDTSQRCMEAVREMPAWSPGIYKDRPVKVKMMMSFSLRQ